MLHVSSFRRLLVAALAVIASRASVAAAQATPYCQRVRARAAADAALLMSPKIVLQGIRFPQNEQLDVGALAGSGYQVRAGMSFSPLDFYKGLGLLQVGEIDCAQHESSVAVSTLLTTRDDGARLQALRAQVAYLQAHRDSWRGLWAKAAERLADRVITLVEFNGLREQVESLEHKLAQAEGEANRLQAKAVPEPPRASLGDLAGRYAQQSTELEREVAHIRAYDAWQLELTGGIVPQAPVDWYGLAELTFNLGAVLRSHYDERYVEARADEVAHAPYELVSQVERFRQEMSAAVAQARRDLEVVDHEIGVLASTGAVLEKSEAEGIAHARDTLTIERVSVESDSVFLRALIDALTPFVEDAHGR
ncbi:MAG TPA: hypothetical protein VEK07_20185 [Polyangiaceae bacterium]|nr:hypothetical protein [Polyangiaceae bacterium]